LRVLFQDRDEATSREFQPYEAGPKEGERGDKRLRIRGKVNHGTTILDPTGSSTFKRCKRSTVQGKRTPLLSTGGKYDDIKEIIRVPAPTEEARTDRGGGKGVVDVAYKPGGQVGGDHGSFQTVCLGFFGAPGARRT